MKQTTTMVMTILCLIAYSSCKKDWTCTCTQSYSNGALPTSVTKVTIPNQTRSSAENGCQAGNSSGSYGGVTYTRNCELE